MDYSKYHFSKKEVVLYSAQAFFLSCVISYLFYRSIWGLVLFLPLEIILCRRKQKELAKQRRGELAKQFRDGILAICAALKVGYSVENAFYEALKDLRINYAKDADIVKEFTQIHLQIKNNMVVEKLLMEFALRSHIEDIRDFAEVFAIAKRNGGDLNKIIQNTASIISEKIEVKQEIQTMITAKQTEQKIMNLIPMLIILYITVTSPHFFDALYHNLFGVLVMSGCLVFYGCGILLAEYITDIEV